MLEMNCSSLNLSSKPFTFLVPRLSKATSESYPKARDQMEIEANLRESYTPSHDTDFHSLFIPCRDNTRLNKYKNQLYGLEWHLARDITVLEKLKLPHPPPCCLDTRVINSHYIQYKTMEIQDRLNPSQHCQGTLTPLPAAVVSVITLTENARAQGGTG